MFFLSALGIFFLILLLYFLPGYLILNILPNLSREEKIAGSFGISSALFMYSSFSAYLLYWNQQIFNLFFLISIISVGIILNRKRKIFSLGEGRSFLPLILFGGYALHAFSMQGLIPTYSGGSWFGDWWIHYRLSQFYLYHGPLDLKLFGKYTIPTRTPLFNINGQFFLSIFGDSFWKFQIFSSIVNTFFILSFFLSVKRLFSYRIALLSTLLLFFLPFIYRNYTYTWPKLFTTYLIFMSLVFYLAIRRKIEKEEKVENSCIFLCGIFAGLSYMAHQFALFYLLAILLDAGFLLSKRNYFPARSIAKFLLAVLLIILPWHAWCFLIYGVRETIFTNPAMSAANYVFPSMKWLMIRIYNLFSLVFPLELMGALWVFIHAKANFLSLYSSSLAYYYGTFPGALTSTLTFTFLWNRLFLRGKTQFVQDYRFLVNLVLFGIVLSIITQAYACPNGIVQGGMVPVVLFLFPFLVIHLDGSSNLCKKLILTFLVVEFVLFVLVQPVFLSRVAEDRNLTLKRNFHLLFLNDSVSSLLPYYSIGILCEFFFVVFVIKTLLDMLQRNQ